MELRKKVGNDIYGVRGDYTRPEEHRPVRLHRSRHYDQYFHGYTEVRVPREKGGYRIQRIYTANWHVRVLPPAQVRLAKLRYALLCALGCGGFGWLMCLPGLGGNRSPWAAVPQIAAVVCMILLVVSVAGYALTKPRMTWWERHSSSDRLRRFSLAAAIAVLLTAALIGVNAFFCGSSLPRELLLAVGTALCSLPLFAMERLEAKMPYAEEENDPVLPQGERFEIQ